jgi:hypothetical protein
MAKHKRDMETKDLFEGFEEVFPIRAPKMLIGRDTTLQGKIKRLISAMLRECSKSREVVAAEMAAMMDRPTFSKAMLDAYSAESREDHQMSLDKFIVMVRATGQMWVWDDLLKDEGLTVLYGEEAVLAERGRIRQEIEALRRRERALTHAKPVKIKRRR